MCLTSTLTDKFQYHGQSIDAENTPPWDQIKNVYITGSLLFLFLIQFDGVVQKGVICNFHQNWPFLILFLMVNMNSFNVSKF